MYNVHQHSPFSYKEKVLVGTWKAPYLNIEHIVRHQSQNWRSLMFIEFPWHRPETATRKWSWRHCLLLSSLDTLPATPLIVWHGGGHRMVSGNTATARTIGPTCWSVRAFRIYYGELQQQTTHFLVEVLPLPLGFIAAIVASCSLIARWTEMKYDCSVPPRSKCHLPRFSHGPAAVLCRRDG